MLGRDIISEKDIKSSWISAASNNRKTKTVLWKLNDGKVYQIKGITRNMFDKWHNSNSKGKFFHRYIKDRYDIVRVR